MTTSNPTPGPWYVGGHPGDCSGSDWRGILTDTTPFGPLYICQALERNAYIIAAAPDMLAALRWVAECVEDGQTPDIEAVRAAIARAEGRQP